MAKPETTESATESDGGEAKGGKRGGGSGRSRDLAARADRSLKGVDRLLRRTPDIPAHERAMAQLEQAKVLALLNLAEAIRGSKKAGVEGS